MLLRDLSTVYFLPSLINVDHHLAAGFSLSHKCIGIVHVLQREASIIQSHPQLPGFGHTAGLAENPAMVLAIFTGQQWQQGEDAGVSRATKGQRRE